MAHTKVQIADLRPTQLTLGLLEVKERAVKLEKQSSADRKSYLEKKAIPYVLGPGSHIYIVDHHHLARALWSIDIREALLGDKVGLVGAGGAAVLAQNGQEWLLLAD